MNFLKSLAAETTAPSAPTAETIDALGGDLQKKARSKAEEENLDEYRFQKFAATYFQGNTNHQYSRKPIKQSLLTLPASGDQLVSRNLNLN
jgi:myosin-7